MNNMNFGQQIGVSVNRGGRNASGRVRSRGIERFALGAGLASALAVGGVFDVRCVTAEGQERWRQTMHNGVTNQGLNKILNVMFQSATQITSWFLDLINTGATLAAGDTYATHAGWTYSSAYSNATRPAWAPAASTAQSSTNSSTVDFTINGTATIYGIAVVAGSSTKGDTASGTGVLWATGAFPGGEQSVVNGDTLKVTYTLNASAS